MSTTRTATVGAFEKLNAFQTGLTRIPFREKGEPRRIAKNDRKGVAMMPQERATIALLASREMDGAKRRANTAAVRSNPDYRPRLRGNRLQIDVISGRADLFDYDQMPVRKCAYPPLERTVHCDISMGTACFMPLPIGYWMIE